MQTMQAGQSTGARMVKRWQAETLKRAFAWCLVVVATYILAKSVI